MDKVKSWRNWTGSRRRLLLLVAVFITAVFVVGTVSISLLYRAAYREQERSLVEQASLWASSIEAIARFDAKNSAGDVQGGAAAATLSQVREAYEHYTRSEHVSELTIAHIEGDQIAFFFHDTLGDREKADRIPLDSPYAVPMQWGLAGKSGTVVGLDYRGVEVLAAYEPIPLLDMAVVVKIDLAQIRAPFFRAGMWALFVAIALVTAGTKALMYLGVPLVARSEENEMRYRTLFESAPIGLWEADCSAVLDCVEQLRAMGVDDIKAHLDRYPQKLAACAGSVRIVDVNQAAINLHGARSKDELLSWLTAAICAESCSAENGLLEMRQFFLRGLKEIAGGARLFKGEVDIGTLENKRVPALVTISFSDFAASFGQLLVCITDISALKDAEVELYNSQRELQVQNVDLRDTQRAMLSIMEDSEEARKQAEAAVAEVQSYRGHLEELVQERTQALRAVNHELEAFSYSVSHDLRAPLRSIDGFSQALIEDYEEQLDEQGKDYLARVRAASQRMAQLIDDMLNLSRLTRGELNKVRVDISAMAREVEQELRAGDPERSVEFVVEADMVVRGDARMLRAVLDNLLGNAWKFTLKKDGARIEFGRVDVDGERAFYVRDNGAGFDMEYVDKLFGAFQRLHTEQEFAGSGIGLATVQRIVHRHGGRAWAEGEVGVGATMYFTL